MNKHVKLIVASSFSQMYFPFLFLFFSLILFILFFYPSLSCFLL